MACLSTNGKAEYILKSYGVLKYGLPQSGKLAYDLLTKRLNAARYHETATTPGLWTHV